MYRIYLEAKSKKAKRKAKRIAWKYGLRKEGYVDYKVTYAGKVSKKQYDKITRRCMAYHITVRFNDAFSQRSTDYRQVFFEKYKPVQGKYYICAYCGKFLTRKKVTVDHIYPVSCAQKSKYMHDKLKKKGYSSINDERNLVAACESCNKYKGSKTGKWIIKGKIGRYKPIWYARYLIRAAIILFVFLSLCYLFPIS